MGKIIGWFVIMLGRSGKTLRIGMRLKSFAKVFPRAKKMAGATSSVGTGLARLTGVGKNATAVTKMSWFSRLTKNSKRVANWVLALLCVEEAFDFLFEEDGDPETLESLQEALEKTLPSVDWATDPEVLYLQLSDVMDSNNRQVINGVLTAMSKAGISFGVDMGNEIAAALGTEEGSFAGQMIRSESVMDEIYNMSVQHKVGDKDPDTDMADTSYQGIRYRQGIIKDAKRDLGASVAQLKNLQKLILEIEEGDFDLYIEENGG